MNNFPAIATVLSMVLGLGVTRLLLGAVAVFRMRRRSRVDWLPLCWAVCLFLIQLEYWWAISQLPLFRPTYSFADFVSLVVLTLMLFAAAALLLPNNAEDEREGLQHYFEPEGRYALLAMSAFSLLGFLADLVFLRAPLMSTWAVLDVPIIALPTLGFLLKKRSMQVAVVCTYLPLLALDMWVSVGGERPGFELPPSLRASGARPRSGGKGHQAFSLSPGFSLGAAKRGTFPTS